VLYKKHIRNTSAIIKKKTIKNILAPKSVGDLFYLYGVGPGEEIKSITCHHE
jgi:hypothetical protein